MDGTADGTLAGADPGSHTPRVDPRCPIPSRRRYSDPEITRENLACGVAAVLRRRTSLMWPEDITALRKRRIADSPFSFSPTVTWKEGFGRGYHVSPTSSG